MKIQNADAFKLMTYQCSRCYFCERIWNSRNAVSPYSVRCTECLGIMYHVDWHLDIFVTDYVLKDGDRYFSDLTQERAKELAVLRVDSAKGTDFELFETKRQQMIDHISEAFFNSDQNMDLLVYKEKK